MNSAVGPTPSQFSLDSTLKSMDQIADEVNQGKWDNRKSELSQKMEDLITNLVQTDHLYEKKNSSKALNMVAKLSDSLERTVTKTSKVRKYVETFQKIKNKKMDQDVGYFMRSELSKHLKSESGNELNTSLSTLRNMTNNGSTESAESLAKWISYNEIPLSKLNLSSQELKLIAPYVQFLDFSNSGMSAEEINSVVEKSTNLTTLNLSATEITKLPKLPGNLKELIVCECPNLSKIEKLSDSVERFQCTDNPKLKKIASFNRNLKNADLRNNSSLESLPKSSGPNLQYLNLSSCPLVKDTFPFGEKLREFDCSDCTHLELADLNESKLKKFTCNRCTFEEFSNLPDTLEYLESMENDYLKSITNAPTNLKIMNVSYCSNLEKVDIPKSLKEIYKAGTLVEIEKHAGLKVYS